MAIEYVKIKYHLIDGSSFEKRCLKSQAEQGVQGIATTGYVQLKNGKEFTWYPLHQIKKVTIDFDKVEID